MVYYKLITVSAAVGWVSFKFSFWLADRKRQNIFTRALCGLSMIFGYVLLIASLVFLYLQRSENRPTSDNCHTEYDGHGAYFDCD